MTYLPSARDAIATRTLDPVDGFTLTAYEVPDTDSTPIGLELENGGCYTADDVAAWRRDEWEYVGVVVVASRAGVDLGSAAIWGMDTGSYWDAITRADGRTPYGVLDNVPNCVSTGHPQPDGTIEYVTRDDFAHGYGEDLIAEALAEARETVAAINAAEPCGHNSQGMTEDGAVVCDDCGDTL